jgi:RND family efflux transporter, MFP subunit
MKRKLIISSAILVVVGLILFGFYYERHKTAKSTPGILVSASAAIQQDVAITIDAIGTVEAYASVSIRSMVEGPLDQVAFNKGDRVHAGQLLFVVDPRTYQAQLDQAIAKLTSDEAQWTNAKSILDRNSKLVNNGYVAKQDYDTMVANVNSAAANVASDKAAVATAKLQLDYCTIHSPISGRAGDILVDAGNLVKANDASPLVVINQLSPIYVKFALPEQNLAALQDQLAKGPLIVMATPNKGGHIVEKGELTFIDNSVDSSTGMIQLKATFSNTNERLWPGQFVTLQLPIAHLAKAVMVPTRAVQSGQLGSYVYAVGPNSKVIYRSIEVGPAIGDNTVIKQGIKPGEKVVTEGQLNLVDGAIVQLSQPLNGS